MFCYNVRYPILSDMDEFQEKDSEWTLHSIVKVEGNINKLNPMKGSPYIDLPPRMKKTEACSISNKCSANRSTRMNYIFLE